MNDAEDLYAVPKEPPTQRPLRWFVYALDVALAFPLMAFLTFHWMSRFAGEDPWPAWVWELPALSRVADWASLVGFVVFTYLAYRQAIRAGSRELRSPLAAVAWLIAPGVNLFMGFSVVRSLWRACGGAQRGSLLLPIWWASFVGYHAVSWLQQAHATPRNDLYMPPSDSGALELLGWLCPVLTIHLVHRIEKHLPSFPHS